MVQCSQYSELRGVLPLDGLNRTREPFTPMGALLPAGGWVGNSYAHTSRRPDLGVTHRPDPFQQAPQERSRLRPHGSG